MGEIMYTDLTGTGVEEDFSSTGPAEAPPPEAPAGAVSRRGWPRRCLRSIAAASEWVFGALALALGLALLAATPVAQFLSLGYLLEAEGRVARSGRLVH